MTIFIIALSILFSSCASFLYFDGRRQKNNTLKISSNTNATLTFPKAKARDVLFFNKSFQVNNNVSEIFIPKLKRRLMTVSVDNTKEVKNIKLKRHPRFSAIFKSTVMSCFTLGLPFIIDPFRPDFYKLSKSSRNLNLQFNGQNKNEYKSDITKNESNKNEKKQDSKREQTSYSSNGLKENSKKIKTDVKNTDYQNSNKSDSNEKLVTLTTIGQGKTVDEAKLSALRSAIEQAFGTFVSANTQILNDELVKDDIATIANGNISKYDVLTEQMLPDNTWLVSVKSDISPQNLVKFCESKGIKVDFKGALFAANVKIMELNKQNELKTIENCFNVACEILPKSYDYSLEVTEPKNLDGKWISEIVVKAQLNDNIKIMADLLLWNLEALSIPDEQINKYNDLNIKTYDLFLLFSKPKKIEKADNENRKKDRKRKDQDENKQQNDLNELILKEYHFRDIKTIESVKYLLGELLYSHSLYFNINNGVEQKKGYDIGCDDPRYFYNTSGIWRNNESKFSIYQLRTNYSRYILTHYVPRNIWVEDKECPFTFSFDNEQPMCVKGNKADFNLSGSRSLYCDDYSNIGREKYMTYIQTLGLKRYLIGIEYHFTNLYSIQQDNIYFKIVLKNTLSTEDISKISQFKVEPIIQKNCDK